ncbi:MAG: formate dehydrogenase accessory sulfurtransferase FdhD [candidate division KSB1 bacterium]
MNLPTKQYAVQRFQQKVLLEATDCLAVEEPLEIRVNGHTLGVVMRTPGDDFELARGFLLSEGVLPLQEINLHLQTLILDCARDEMHLEIPNVVHGFVPGLDLERVQACQRQMVATSSCGICGRASLERVRLQALQLNEGFRCAIPNLQALAARIATQQTSFVATGGLHAAALFKSNGEILNVREDIGRHNAVDKVIGAALLQHPHPLSSCGLWVSGRLSFEIAQKALLAGIPLVVAVSAASSLAVDLARETGMTLVGFLREEHAVVYHGKQRVMKVDHPIP